MIKNVIIYNDINITTTFESSDIGSLISLVSNQGVSGGSGPKVYYDKNGGTGKLENEFTSGLLKKAGASLSFITSDADLQLGITYDQIYEDQINKYEYEIYLNDESNPSYGWYMGHIFPGDISFVWDDGPWIYQLIQNKNISVKIVLVKK